MDVFLENNLLRGLGHDQFGEVPLVGIVPTALAGVAISQAQQKTLEPLPRFALVAHGGKARPDQIPNRFVLLVGDVNDRQFPGSIQPGQLFGIPAIGLHPIGSFLRGQ
jgi:hypothetical protein